MASILVLAALLLGLPGPAGVAGRRPPSVPAIADPLGGPVAGPVGGSGAGRDGGDGDQRVRRRDVGDVR